MAALILAPAETTTVAVDHPIYGERPRLRGRFHQLGAVVSLPASAALVVDQAEPGTRLAASSYGLTCVLLFLTSAAYHRLAQSVLARFWMRRLDHSMILLHIGGATTPIALIGVGGGPGRVLLAASWTGVVVGIGLKMTRLTASVDPCPWIFPLLGWLPLAALPSLASRSAVDAALLLGAAVVYGIGTCCFARQRPNPVPMVFGFHEIFHVCTLIAGTCQFALTFRLVG